MPRLPQVVLTEPLRLIREAVRLDPDPDGRRPGEPGPVGLRAVARAGPGGPLPGELVEAVLPGGGVIRTFSVHAAQRDTGGDFVLLELRGYGRPWEWSPAAAAARRLVDAAEWDALLEHAWSLQRAAWAAGEPHELVPDYPLPPGPALIDPPG